MIPRIPTDPVQRAERKANLLLASELMRGQAALSVDDVGQRADGWVRRILSWRDLLTNPVILAAASGGAALFAGAGADRRGKLWRGLRWAWLAYKVWGRRKR
ncbi:hypothetical protein J2X20_003490 [Pelomonas saccharophila]|uniref:YqjK-like protein n=1 Tax=Roseateles saccharophilus TaxID=304 RepID=A0ABU1YPQ1_ROSSA|nr:hypothetical protein [Roseateles saccharophilus]MDR7270832.1 hypothetical protein [Roseateles saccharophilus]